jgi:hypothetical protein
VHAHLGAGSLGARSSRTKAAAEKRWKEYAKAVRYNRLREFLLGTDAREVQPDATSVGCSSSSS